MSNLGLTIFALGEISRAENAAQNARIQSAGVAIARAKESEERLRAAEELDKKVENYVFCAKSHVHGLRSYVWAHRQTEERLIAALKAENANNPLASKEAIDVILEDERVKALTNPEVIKKTYPDGVLPKGAIVDGRMVKSIA